MPHHIRSRLVDSMDNFRDSRANTVVNWPCNQFCSWFLRAFNDGDFYPVPIFAEPSAPVQVSQIFSYLPAAAQEAMKGGLTRAIREWLPTAHSPSALGDMAATAAYIKASASLPPLVQVLESRYFRPPRSAPVQELCDTIISVIGGFVPLSEVHHIFSRLFWDKGFVEYGAQFFVGLCACMPAQYPKWSARFVDLATTTPHCYDLNAVLTEFIRVTTLPIFEQGLTDLLREHNGHTFLQLLATHEVLEFRPHIRPYTYASTYIVGGSGWDIVRVDPSGASPVAVSYIREANTRRIVDNALTLVAAATQGMMPIKDITERISQHIH